MRSEYSSRLREARLKAYPSDIDERLFHEVELPLEAVKQLGAGKAPLSLFLNLGWLLSDDERNKVVHMTARPGQVAVRIMHWLALAKWAGRHDIMSTRPTVFKLSISYTAQTQEGPSSLILIRPIGRTTEAIEAAYGRFGLQIGDAERVKQLGYEIMRVLREAAFEKRGKAYTVKHVDAWLAFAAALKTLVLGDGVVSRTRLGVTVEERLTRKLAGVLNGCIGGHCVWLRQSMARILPPILPTLFERDVALYRSLALFVKGLEVSIGSRSWVLGRRYGNFETKGLSATELAEALKGVLGDVPYTNGVLRLSEGKAMRLVEMGLARLLSELEHEAARRIGIRRVYEELRLTQTEVEALTEAAKLARRVSIFPFRLKRGDKVYVYERVLLYYDSEEKLNRALEVLQRIRYQPTVYWDRKRIIVVRREYVELLKRIKQNNPDLFSDKHTTQFTYLSNIMYVIIT